MNPAKQFWALLKFQGTINPLIWFMAFALSMPFLFKSDLPSSYHPSFHSLLNVQNLFFVGIVGLIVLVPERFSFGRASGTWNPGTEFLLTRAIDRRILLRSRSAFFYALMLVAPLAVLLLTIRSPALTMTEYSDTARNLCLQSVPGSALLPDPSGNRFPLISIPQGGVLIEEWHCWLILGSIMGVQALLLLLYPFKYRAAVFYIVFFGLVFAPLEWDLDSMASGMPSTYQRMFFVYAAHPVDFWIITFLAVVIVQLWCERQFARMEF
jgi:hypothetical protein